MPRLDETSRIFAGDDTVLSVYAGDQAVVGGRKFGLRLAGQVIDPFDAATGQFVVAPWQPETVLSYEGGDLVIGCINTQGGNTRVGQILSAEKLQFAHTSMSWGPVAIPPATSVLVGFMEPDGADWTESGVQLFYDGSASCYVSDPSTGDELWSEEITAPLVGRTVWFRVVATADFLAWQVSYDGSTWETVGSGPAPWLTDPVLGQCLAYVLTYRRATPVPAPYEIRLGGINV